MRGMRNTGFVVSLALLASVAAHVAIQRHFERRVRIGLTARGSDFASSNNVPTFNPNLAISEIDPAEMARFPRVDRPFGQIIPALDIQDEKRAAVSPPTAVPPPSDAVPVETRDDNGAADQDSDTARVREVIEKELSHATREEREIWFEELKTLPPGVVSELLQVRKQLRALPRLLGGMPERLASSDPAVPPLTHEISAEPASQKIRFNVPDHHASVGVLETAISQLRHNLMNAATPGFKRFRVAIVDAYGSAWHETSTFENTRDSSARSPVQGEGCRLAPLLLDLQQGTLKKTTRQFDLAIDGEGFFVVRRGNKDLLTRCGAFTLDRDRQLCLSVVNELAVLQPAITIPEDARELQISAEGNVTVLKSGEATLTEIGHLQLARVASPARLQPLGDTLLDATEESGAFAFGAPMASGFGEIQQGCLEQSNVDFERELDEIEQLAMILKALPMQSSRPATAKSLQQSPAR